MRGSVDKWVWHPERAGRLFRSYQTGQQLAWDAIGPEKLPIPQCACHIYHTSKCWLFTYMNQQYKWFDTNDLEAFSWAFSCMYGGREALRRTHKVPLMWPFDHALNANPSKVHVLHPQMTKAAQSVFQLACVIQGQQLLPSIHMQAAVGWVWELDWIHEGLKCR